MATTDLSSPEGSLDWEILQQIVVPSAATAEETLIGDNLKHIDSVNAMLLRVVKETGALAAEAKMSTFCFSSHNVNSLYVLRFEGIYMSHNSCTYYTLKFGKLL
jgi:hypothetical protein